MGVSGDGRLELDELGSVIDHASSLGPTSSEDVLAGNEQPTFGQRLESSGVAPWARRHALALGVAAAVVVAGGALRVGWEQSRPPPLDPAISGSVADAMADGTAPYVPGTIYDGELVLALRVEKGNDRDTIDVLGIAGPVVRASTAVPVTTAAVPGVVDVFVVPGCDDPRSFASTFDDYRLRVRRTDTYGRTPGSHVVLSDGSYLLTAYVSGGPPTVATVTTDVVPGRVVVDVDWAAQCSSVVGPPPVWLVVTTGGTTYPYRTYLDGAVLARAYSAACPGTVPSDLTQFGWATG